MKEKFSSRENSSDVAFRFFPRLGDNFFPQTVRKYLPRTRGSPRGEWQLRTVRTQARSTDPSWNDSDELKHKPNPCSHVLSLPWTFCTFGRHSSSARTVRRKPHAVHGDIRISFIHTNFGTNLDLRKPRRREVYESRSILSKLTSIRFESSFNNYL